VFQSTGRYWPVREIPTFKLLAENRPFGSARRDQFKRNRQRQVVAGCCRLRQVIIVVSQHNHLAGLPAQHHQNPQVSTHFEHP